MRKSETRGDEPAVAKKWVERRPVKECGAPISLVANHLLALYTRYHHWDKRQKVAEKLLHVALQYPDFIVEHFEQTLRNVSDTRVSRSARLRFQNYCDDVMQELWKAVGEHVGCDQNADAPPSHIIELLVDIRLIQLRRPLKTQSVTKTTTPPQERAPKRVGGPDIVTAYSESMLDDLTTFDSRGLFIWLALIHKLPYFYDELNRLRTEKNEIDAHNAQTEVSRLYYVCSALLVFITYQKQLFGSKAPNRAIEGLQSPSPIEVAIADKLYEERELIGNIADAIVPLDGDQEVYANQLDTSLEQLINKMCQWIGLRLVRSFQLRQYVNTKIVEARLSKPQVKPKTLIIAEISKALASDQHFADTLLRSQRKKWVLTCLVTQEFLVAARKNPSIGHVIKEILPLIAPQMSGEQFNRVLQAVVGVYTVEEDGVPVWDQAIGEPGESAHVWDFFQQLMKSSDLLDELHMLR